MTGKTHGAIGLAAGIGLVHVTGAETWWQAVIPIAVSFFASLLPDIDAEQSLLQSKILPNLSRQTRTMIFMGVAVLLAFGYFLLEDMPLWMILISLFLGIASFAPHRTITHSLLMVVYLGWTVNMISPEYMWAFVVGYLSHLIADAMTVSGIPFLWPVPQRISLSMIGIRIRTGSAIDQGIRFVAIGFFVLGIFYLFV